MKDSVVRKGYLDCKFVGLVNMVSQAPLRQVTVRLHKHGDPIPCMKSQYVCMRLPSTDCNHFTSVSVFHRDSLQLTKHDSVVIIKVCTNPMAIHHFTNAVPPI